MTISIVMTTYNANSHLKDQLESLRLQELQADEVLIFDDCSDNGTPEVVAEYIKQHNLENWKLKIREENYGWRRNFMEGMREATGDYIFPCDQDDVWYPNKLRDMTKTMEEDRSILLLASDYHVVYEDGSIKAIVYDKTDEEKNGLVSKYGFTKRFSYNRNPGCTYCIRKTFFDKVNGLWFPEAPHDEFLWLMSTVCDGTCFYNRDMMDFIRHDSNASYIRFKDVALQIKNLNYIGKMLTQLDRYATEHSGEVPADRHKTVLEAQKWCRKRLRLMETRNPIRWLLLAPWWGYYSSAKNCLSDLWLVLFGSFSRGPKQKGSDQ